MVGFHLVNTEPTMSLQRKIDMEEIKKGRGKGIKPARVLVSIRLDKEIVDFFKKKHSRKWHAEMRRVLTTFMEGASK